MSLSMLPLGFTFSPTNEELLNYYLYHKIVGDYNPPFALPVIDLYSLEPSLIWQKYEAIDGQDFHCFTTLQKKKSRIVRKVGSNDGTWSGENKVNLVYSSTNALIGTLKRFHYKNPKLKVSDDYSWIMYEYTLDPTAIPKGIVHDSYVLCKIRKRIVKKEKKVLPTKIQTFACSSTTTSIEVYDQNHKSIEVIDLENQSCINMNTKFTEDGIKKLLTHNDLETTKFEKDIRPSTNNQHAEMSTRMQMKVYDHNPKWRKLVEGVDLENPVCNNMELTENDREPLQWNGLKSVVPLNAIPSSTDIQPKVCPTTQMEPGDQVLDVEMFAKLPKSPYGQCNTVEHDIIEKDSSYNNE